MCCKSWYWWLKDRFYFNKNRHFLFYGMLNCLHSIAGIERGHYSYFHSLWSAWKDIGSLTGWSSATCPYWAQESWTNNILPLSGFCQNISLVGNCNVIIQEVNGKFLTIGKLTQSPNIQDLFRLSITQNRYVVNQTSLQQMVWQKERNLS